MNKILSRTLLPLSLAIIPLAIFLLPSYKDKIIACTELCAESSILIQLALLCLRSRKRVKFDWSVLVMSTSIICIFFADMIYSARLIKITNNYGLLSDCLYTGFAAFLMLFLFIKLDIFKRKFHEWGWIFLAAFFIDAFFSFKFLLSPYYLTADPLAWKINGTVYMILTTFIYHSRLQEASENS